MPRVHMISVLVMTSALALAASVQAQSMNIPAITRDVGGSVCAPFIENQNITAAIEAAELLGYRVMESDPEDGAGPDAPARAVRLWRSHGGRITLTRRGAMSFCTIGMAEGSVETIAETAEPFLRALGMTPVLDEREGPTAISIWRGEGRKAIIARSLHHRPGSELVMSVATPR
jgi:hypothetical protein